MKAERLAEDLNSYNLPGVHFRPQWFTPTFSKYKDELCGGVFLHITDRKAFNSMRTSWVMLNHIRTKYPDDFKINKPYVEGRPTLFHFEAGHDTIIENSVSLEEQFKLLDEAQNDFIKLREKYLLY